MHEVINKYINCPSRTEKMYRTVEYNAMYEQLASSIRERKESWTLAELPVGCRFQLTGNLRKHYRKLSETENEKCKCSFTFMDFPKDVRYCDSSSQTKVCRVSIPGVGTIPEPFEFGLNSKKIQINDFCKNKNLLRYYDCKHFE